MNAARLRRALSLNAVYVLWKTLGEVWRQSLSVRVKWQSIIGRYIWKKKSANCDVMSSTHSNNNLGVFFFVSEVQWENTPHILPVKKKTQPQGALTASFSFCSNWFEAHSSVWYYRFRGSANTSCSFLAGERSLIRTETYCRHHLKNMILMKVSHYLILLKSIRRPQAKKMMSI